MNCTAKSPIWAKIMLAICVILRFCDPLLFEEKNTGKTVPEQVTGKTDTAEKNAQSIALNAAPLDSVACARYFLR